MATFSSLIRGIIHGDLPPAGEKIVWREQQPLPTYEGFDAYWVDSGTSALALTIIAARQLQPDIKKPEVIIPAYGCPDLVAAAVYAEVQPVLVDIGTNDPGYDLNQLENAINHNTIAVIAVNFLGISDRLTEIKALLSNKIILIEDNAQCYKALSKPDKITGDFAITSFGRGKPVGLLGGGLALIRSNYSKNISLNHIIKKSKHGKAITIAKILLYNLLLNPHAYWLINHLPFLHLGETKYTPLKEISSLDIFRRKITASNIEKHINQINHPNYQTLKGDNLSIKYKERLVYPLRIPLLTNNAEETPKSKIKNLGISRLYKCSLIEIKGIEGIVKPNRNTNAESLARRLLTLPCHTNVKEKEVLFIQKTLNETH